MRQEAIPPAFAREGALMLEALACDLLAAPTGVELIILHDDRLPPPRIGGGGRAEIVPIRDGAAFSPLWRESLGRCDAAWPIAPETAGVLERLCLDAEAAGVPLLTSPAAAVRLAASKLATLERLARHGLPVARTAALADWMPTPGRPFVVKPDDGAGCEGARIIRDPVRLQMPADPPGWIAQDLLAGEALSLSALFAQGQARRLSGNRQLIEQTGDGFALAGCRVNAFADEDGQWQALADGVARALPELWGYAGIDLILGANGPAILEVNPRLTTSYAGLRRALGENPAAFVLELWKTGQLPGPRRARGQAVDISLEAGNGV